VARDLVASEAVYEACAELVPSYAAADAEQVTVHWGLGLHLTTPIWRELRAWLWILRWAIHLVARAARAALKSVW
jgi:hypothetical protein